ncbi:hypothetical protein GGS23DRAFT_268795 [Durotheca rogersii]|uniref:uncharacterized protein n=1 Tax=Durotheca rogersii TaxID=419775 RepID=UPI00221FF4D8|nr:uncharacterized protein GGS23DRAFT_268795 [Durotheca rogersii]KAI5859748.1 hypothetical protein GGS23DRAFT_268795 [Durotheca rogersii]
MIHTLPSQPTMLASVGTVPSAASTALYFEPLNRGLVLGKPTSSTQRAFRKHKVLPHPSNDRVPSTTANRLSRDLSSTSTTSIRESCASEAKQPATPPNPKHESPNLATPGPVLPPTPPAHSCASSGRHPVQPSSLTYVDSPAQSATAGSARTIPGTPPNQTSPPTPDVTPPQAERRPRSRRPPIFDRIPSKATTTSRSASFKTAREDPDSSEEDVKLSTPRPPLSSSSRLSQSAVGGDTTQRKTRNVGLGLGLESDESLTPKSKRNSSAFGSEWGTPSEVELEWDADYARNLWVEKRRVPPKTNRRREEVVDDVIIAPTNATKALRSIPLSDRLYTNPSPLPLDSANRDKPSTAPSTSASSISTDLRRSSIMSSKSTVSTIVEAILVETPPQRRKTLRHVRKQPALRGSNSELSPSTSSASTSLRQVDNAKRSRAPARAINGPARSESLASTATANSISSRKARREVWRNGGIPVVVIPDRRASIKATGAPSLRSTSSRHTRRSNSINSAPLSKVMDSTPYFDKPSGRGRSMSESDGVSAGDQLTMDYPPIVPVRRSSLSAPTSRNGSRAGSRSGSLTAESLKAHDAFLEQQGKQSEHHPERQPPPITVERAPPVEEMRNHPDQRQPRPVLSVESHRDASHDHKPLVDNNGDPLFGVRLTAYNTPFSQASVETNGTHSAADISEALAVNIYPHQNKSVLMIHHMSKPIDPAVIANVLREERPAQTASATETGKFPDIPKITATDPGGAPVTPPHPQFSMDDVDSPLRNPRAPPAPPTIKHVLDNPSGLTPATENERTTGNYHEEAQNQPSLMRRAFSLRKDPETGRPSGFLSRTLSLSKTIRKDAAENPEPDRSKNVKLGRYPAADDRPLEKPEPHLHWQAPFEDGMDDDDDDDDWPRDTYDIPAEVEKIYRYPQVNYAAGRRRSLSEQIRRTFSILPIEDEDHYTTRSQRGPERRTIKRTPSGNLRVMRHRDSYGSVEWDDQPRSREDAEGRPSTAPETLSRRAWGAEKRVDDRGRRLFPGWQDKLEQYRPQNLQRRLSEHRRQKRTEALRQKISGPREVRDGVGEVIKRNSYTGPSYQTPSEIRPSVDGKSHRPQPGTQARREGLRF